MTLDLKIARRTLSNLATSTSPESSYRIEFLHVKSDMMFSIKNYPSPEISRLEYTEHKYLKSRKKVKNVFRTLSLVFRLKRNRKYKPPFRLLHPLRFKTREI
ncbi:hypothetical protein LEP1GSC130_0289 [Leptospira santarosai str. 200403458]|nr:hypothetical protein LEP1GSC130_0289 [Leptospira santarosai str. 200403458]